MYCALTARSVGGQVTPDPYRHAMTHLQRLIVTYTTGRANRGEIAPGTARDHEWILTAFTREHAHIAPDRIRRHHVEAMLAVPGVAPATRRNRLSVFRGFARWLVTAGHATLDPTVGIASPRQPRHLPRALTPCQSAKVVAAAPDARTLLMVLLMLQEGLRRAEVAAIEAGDVDLHRGELDVRGKGGCGHVTRRLPISDETRRALDAYLAEVPPIAGPLIRSRRDPDQGVAPPTVGRIVAAVMTTAGVKQRPRDGRSAHALRHSCANDMLDGPADVHQVQAALGHRSLVATQIYLRGRVEPLRAPMGGRRYTTRP